MNGGDGIVPEAGTRDMFVTNRKARRIGSEWLSKGLDDMLSAFIMSIIVFSNLVVW
jgi:hypothetical protein